MMCHMESIQYSQAHDLESIVGPSRVWGCALGFSHDDDLCMYLVESLTRYPHRSAVSVL